jgi:hypothetical protein
VAEEKVTVRVETTGDTRGAEQVSNSLNTIRKQAGDDIPSASKFLEQTFGKAWEVIHTGIRSVRIALGTLMQGLGLISLAVGALMTAYKMLKGTQEEEIKATQQSFDKHNQLIAALDKEERSAAGLTVAHRNLKTALMAVAKDEADVLVENEKRKEEAARKSLEFLQRAMAIQTDLLKRYPNDEDIKKNIKELSAGINRVTADLRQAQNQQIELALPVGDKERREKEARDLQEAEDIKLQIKSAGFKAALDDENTQREARDRLIWQWEQSEIDRINAAGKIKGDTEDLIQARRNQILAAGAAMRKKISDAELAQQRQFATAVVQSMVGAFNAEIGLKKSAAGKLEAIGREGLKTVLSIAQQEATVQGVRATMGAFAHGSKVGGLAGGIAEAAATAVAWASLVAALGAAGAYVSGGFKQTAPTPEQEPFNQPSGAGGGDGGWGKGGTVLSPVETGPKNVITVNVTGARDPAEAHKIAREIEEQLALLDRS